MSDSGDSRFGAPPSAETTSYRADVVIVGAGLAGIATAIELLDHGRSVVLLDRAPEEAFGGLARWSFGGVFVVGSPEQRRNRIADSPELALRDWLTTGELDETEIWPRRWAEAYVHRSRELVYDWLREIGLRFLPVVHWVERGLHEPGNSVPRFHIVWGTGEGMIAALRRRLLGHPHADRLTLRFGHRVTELTTTGGCFTGCAGLVEPPSAALPDPDATGGQGPGDGSTKGDPGAAGDAHAAAQPTGEEEATDGRRFVARGESVVLASGGIAGNLDLVRRHWYAPWGEPPGTLLNGSHPYADGALHEVVERHGGVVTHLDRMWLYAAGVRHWRPEHEDHGLSLVPPKSALWVSWRGERMGPPPLVTGFDTRWLVETICRQERKYSWQILNWKIARKELAVSGAEFNDAIRERSWPRFLATLLLGNGTLVRELVDSCPDFVVADGVPQLVQRMNALTGSDDVDAELLAAEIRSYDEAVARGPALRNDDQLRRIAHARRWRGDRIRTCKAARIDDPRARPLIAIREHVTTRKSLGGMQTDLESRVLDGAGEPLPGLYAVGEAAGFGGGGVHGLRSLEGTFLGGCILSGRLAARSIDGG